MQGMDGSEQILLIPLRENALINVFKGPVLKITLLGSGLLSSLGGDTFSGFGVILCSLVGGSTPQVCALSRDPEASD